MEIGSTHDAIEGSSSMLKRRDHGGRERSREPGDETELASARDRHDSNDELRQQRDETIQ